MRWLIRVWLNRPKSAGRLHTYLPAQWLLLERPPCVREVVCSIPVQAIPNDLNMILLYCSFGLVQRDWAECYVMCLARDILVRQHSKGEYWASCHIKTSSRRWTQIELNKKKKKKKKKNNKKTLMQSINTPDTNLSCITWLPIDRSVVKNCYNLWKVVII